MNKEASLFELRCLRALTIALALGSAIMTGYFGSSFGGDHWFFQGLLFVIFFGISLLCPILVNKLANQVLRRSIITSLIIAPFAVFFVFVDIVTNGGTSSFIRESEVMLSETQNLKAKNARGEVTRLEKRIETIRSTTAWQNVYRDPITGKEYTLNAPAAYDERIAAAQLAFKNEGNRGGCKRKCEERKQELATLQAMRAAAVERQSQKEEMLLLERELKDAKLASAETPTRASAAMTHSRNLAAGLTGQIDPGEKETFWAQYQLSILTGLAVTLANIAAPLMLALSTARLPFSRGVEDPAWERNPIPDNRTHAEAATEAGQALLVHSRHDHTDDSLTALMEAVERINKRAESRGTAA